VKGVQIKIDRAWKKRTPYEPKVGHVDLPTVMKRKEVEKHGKRRSSGAVTYEAQLSSGREIFSRKGYSGTSVREIVASAGVTKPGSAKPTGEERG
jgi:hypothetical protein